VKGQLASFVCSPDPEYDLENTEIHWKFLNKTLTNVTTNNGSQSSAEIQLSPKHNGKSVSCEVHHPNLKAPVVKEIKLEVECKLKRKF
jgi:hypothetical protein